MAEVQRAVATHCDERREGERPPVGVVVGGVVGGMGRTVSRPQLF